MGSYIYVSMATQILVMKRRNRFPFQEMTSEEICERMKSCFDMDLYDYYENEKVVSFVLKDGVLKSHLYDYLFELFDGLFDDQEIKDDLYKLLCKDDEEMMLMIQRDDLDCIHFDDIYMMQPFYLLDDLDIYFEGINFLSEGKAFLEESYELFRFIHQLMRKSSQNPLKETTYLHIH